jgi:hypothetical protein
LKYELFSLIIGTGADPPKVPRVKRNQNHLRWGLHG